MSVRQAASLRIRNFNGRRAQKALRALGIAATIALTGCGSVPPPPTSPLPPPSMFESAGEASPTISPTKPGLRVEEAALSGWRSGAPLVSVHSVAAPPGWTEYTVNSSGWTQLGSLPEGSVPVTDGTVVANAIDPIGNDDIAILDAADALRSVRLPIAPWVDSWRGVHGLAPLQAESGFLLVGAGAIARVNDSGALTVENVPEGFVALAPTSDSRRFLLATLANANEPGGLSASTPFGAFLWSVGSKDPPLVLRQQVVGVAQSTVGLAWLHGDDGSWWSVSATGSLTEGVSPQARNSFINSDGTAQLRLDYAMTGCSQGTQDPCQVTLVDQAGSTRQFDGPAFGADFAGARVAAVLVARPSLNLPWRLLLGDIDDATTVPFK